MTNNKIPIKTIEQIVNLMEPVFTSHDFIRKLITHHPATYGQLLVKHNNVATAHAEIANYLRHQASILQLQEYPDKEVSMDILGNMTPSAKWVKIS